jgi:hypothetical protein
MKQGDNRGRWGSASKRAAGPHMITTEAQTLDEVLDILKDKQRRKPSPPTLRQELGLSKLQRRNVTLPMGGVKLTPIKLHQQNRGQTSVIGHQPWTEAEVVEAYRSGIDRIVDLGKLAKVPLNRVRAWLYKFGVWEIPEVVSLERYQDMLKKQKERLAIRRAKSKDIQERRTIAMRRRKKNNLLCAPYEETISEWELKSSIEYTEQQIKKTNQLHKDRLVWIKENE